MPTSRKDGDGVVYKGDAPLTPAEKEEMFSRVKGLGSAELEERKRNLAGGPEVIAGNMKRWHAHPWHMIEDGVIWTLDQVDMKNPIKQFPDHRWLRVITEEWLEHKLLAIPKSRRMMMTWLMIYLHLWLAMFHEGVSVYMVSDSEKKSADMVTKAEFIFDHIPAGTILKPEMHAKHCLMDFPKLHSYMMGIPEGANQMRQYTATALYFDEFPFWERPSESLGAARPCIDGGGRLTIVSSPLEGPFHALCFDHIE